MAPNEVVVRLPLGVLVQPPREPLMQPRPAFFRQLVVGRVTHQHVIEAQRALTGQIRALGADEPLAKPRQDLVGRLVDWLV